MKTKIIYISGGEKFAMADVRAAFEEVRAALSLGDDTIMFGVPVDADDALGDAEIQNNVIAEPMAPVTDDIVIEEPTPAPAPEIEIVTADIPEQTTPEISEIAPDTPKKKTRGRKKASDAQPIDNETDDEPVVETAADVAAAPVVPILSVLASGKPAETNDTLESVADDDITDDATDTDDTDEDITDAQPVATVAEMTIIETVDDEESHIEIDAAIQTVNVEDMITDDAPVVVAQEKTLEELLESMAPLSEDQIINTDDAAMDQIDIADEAADDTPNDFITDGTDATLEQLATEFAENQDKIPVQKKNEGGGKIGKLKNILPFKKVKREDTGLMGDLFGWAGIAANDEDFAIPGFFTHTASNK